MKIVIDDKIPYIQGVLEPYAETVYLPGGRINAGDLRDADALIIRTRTLCNASLLDNTSVRFIATATIGYDHIDTGYCEKSGIAWSNAPGCNSGSVAQYIASALLCLSSKYKFRLQDKTIGIVGVGNVGKKVEKMAKAFGMNVLLNDPPRAREEGEAGFVSLGHIAGEADIITFHTPLIKTGVYQTRGLVNKDFISGLGKKPLLINSARGEIMDTSVLIEAVEEGRIKGLAIDCWENEPDINLNLLQKAAIATPHIAGYSADGKANATSISVQAVSRFFGLGLEDWAVSAVPSPPEPVIYMDERDTVDKAIFHTYDILADDGRLRKNPLSFEKLREAYPLRREFGAYKIEGKYLPLLQELGFEHER